MSRNMSKLVATYLMSAYLYSTGKDTVLDDPTYDNVCKVLYGNFDSVTHQHKKYLDREALKTGTTMHFDWNTMPRIIQTAAVQWAATKSPAKKVSLILEVLNDKSNN